MEILLLGHVLREHQLVHILLDRVDRLQVVLDIHQDLSNSLIDLGQLYAETADLLFCLLAFREDVVVALVLL